MTGIEIVPQADAYGGDSRTSALADVLEVQAATATSMTEAQLTDYIADAEWGRRWASKFNDIGEADEDASPTARDLASGAFHCIAERADLLGDVYPYKIRCDRVTRLSHQVVAYDVFLAISIGHAYKVHIGVNPRDYLEEVVVRGLRNTGLRATGLALRQRDHGEDFAALVREACKQIGLLGNVGLVRRRKRAFDGGADVLAYVALEPRRNSVITAVGQITCAQSDHWEHKLSEAKPPMWQKILSSEVSPVGFLAVPYHVETRHLRFLEEGQNALVLDRLSLASCLHGALAPSDAAVGRLLSDIVVVTRYPGRNDVRVTSNAGGQCVEGA